MNVLIVEPGFAPYEAEIKDDYRDMQKVVGGLIQAIYPFKKQVAIVCNDEALLLDMPFNRSVEGGYGGVFGTFFVCGIEGENFCSLTPEQMETYKKKYHHAEILIGAVGNEPVTLKVQPQKRNAADPHQRSAKSPER